MGTAEGRQPGLQIDRTSCHEFQANRLHIFLTAGAYVLMQETAAARCQQRVCSRPGDVAARPAAKTGAEVV